MSSPARSKGWGYEVERQAEKALQKLDPSIRRTGASSQKVAGAPDLATPRTGTAPLLLVVTKDKGPGSPLLVSLPMADLITIATVGWPVGAETYVQVKGRARTWIGSLYAELKESAKEWVRQHPYSTPVRKQQESEARG